MRTKHEPPGQLVGAHDARGRSTPLARHVSSVLACALSLYATGTRAQAADAAATAAADPRADSDILEEITITADRPNSFGADYVQAGTFRNARVIDTPLTVEVLPRTLLDAQQAVSMGDAVKGTAGVTFSQVSPAVYSNLAIRGIPVENRSNYRLNGSLPIVNLIDLPLEDKERVEVLKGVASLYYGFTTPSGIVNLTMKRPPAEPVMALTLNANEHGGYGGHADVGSRFADDKLGFRINIAHSELETGVDRVGGKRDVGALAFDWNPTESIDVNLDAEYIRKKITETATITLPAAVNGVTQLPPLLDTSTSLSSEWMYSDADELNLLGRFAWRFTENWSVTAEAGRSRLVRDRRYNTFRNYNLATGNGQLQVLLSNGNEYVNENYRLELAGGFKTGPLVHQLSLGGTSNTREALVPSNPTVTYAQNYFDPVVVPETALPPRVIANPSEITDEGFYAFDRVSIGSKFDVLFGVRRTEYENESLTGTPYATTDTSKSGGLVFKPLPILSVYAAYMEGLEEGGVAPLTAVNGGEVLPPAISEQKELGVKWEALDGFLVTLAYFDIDRPSSFLNAANRFVQDGRSNYKGWEASAAGEIGRYWSVSLNAMDLDAKQEQARDASVIGKRPENTPRYTGSAFAEYRPPFLEGLGLSAGAVYCGDRAINNANTAFIGSFITYDVGVSYAWQMAETRMNLRFKVENVTDEEYWASTGANLLSPSLPRTAKLALETRF